eukprot:UN26278
MINLCKTQKRAFSYHMKNQTVQTHSGLKRIVDYYQKQGILSKEEIPKFLETVQEKSPTCFSISKTLHSELGKQLNKKLENDDFKLNSLNNIRNSTNSENLKRIKWVRNDSWEFLLGKTQLSLKSVPEVNAFRDVIVREENNGVIRRQDSVSMIPVHVLDVEPCHTVLDVCAAPGNKTAQIIEALHIDKETGQYIPNPEGFVFANDYNEDRCDILIKTLVKTRSPNFLVTSIFGQRFPELVP